MVCQQCGTLNPDSRERCFRCQHALAPGRAVDEKRCQWHPNRDRYVDCALCGTPMCGECAIEVERVSYCPDCAALPGDRASPDRRERVFSSDEMTRFEVATAGQRSQAGAIDLLIVTIGAIVLALVFWILSGVPVGLSWTGGLNLFYWSLVLLGAGAFYTGSFLSTGQTPGYQAIELLVIGQDGRAVTASMAAVRYLIGIVSHACVMLGNLWMLWDVDHRTWHDRASGTLVLCTGNPTEE